MGIEEIKNKVFEYSGRESIESLSVLDFKYALGSRIITEEEYDFFWTQVDIKDYRLTK